jgi:hypothetical protein
LGCPSHHPAKYHGDHSVCKRGTGGGQGLEDKARRA